MDVLKMFGEVVESNGFKKVFAKIAIEQALNDAETQGAEAYQSLLEQLDEQASFTVEEKADFIRRLNAACTRAGEEVIRNLKAQAYDEKQAEEVNK
ncbi:MULTISPECIES: hypothetical protein [Bacillus]|uniref:hypothetical protein n=1 Tax=Bacillus TaxID=1386 RepID=UPI000814E80C|nr:hypothetical protein [Bacillus glycinifermentans]WKB78775.1 hypothetical protein QYM22_08050 [Bacillus glycinifermentans]SCA85326.1 hypothetical protein BGLY_1503 [Bacillus glycinifermentans]